MAEIHILSHDTIDKIAAGEVVERPSSIVKELVENAVDAGATAITVEIKDGGIRFIRISDNGCGIEKSEIRKAFLRHATSKIQDAADLAHLHSLGFRGEALSSISAVSQVEMITRTKDALTGVRISMEGAKETDFEEIGAPEGTTIIVRNLFYNVPVRYKFLKQPSTEGGYVADLMEHLALANPQISFQFIQNKQVKFSTAGNGNLKQVIYKLYGKEMADSVLEIDREEGGIHLSGYLGKPVCNRSNRNYELYFLNGRFIRSKIISGALEEGYKAYLMQHKYPFCVLMMDVEPSRVDVNVHPSKMEVRFTEEARVYQLVAGMVKEALQAHEMIPEITLTVQEKEAEKEKPLEPFQKKREAWQSAADKKTPERGLPKTSKDFFIDFDEEENTPLTPKGQETERHDDKARKPEEPKKPAAEKADIRFTDFAENFTKRAAEDGAVYHTEQMDLFEEKILSETSRKKFRILGQVFDTFWIVVFEDKLLMIDQHAAHEKVKYERIMKTLAKGEVLSQNLYPPMVISLSGKEQEILQRYQEAFRALGFELEYFGGKEITVRSAPTELFGNTMKEMFLEVLDELSATGAGRAKSIEDRIATMACKAAVKGNTGMSVPEMEALLDELLTLENPYFCPHGRPTIISFSKQELEKKFKRIV